jgi:cell division protein FtsI (penicillin-binding protein 3)
VGAFPLNAPRYAIYVMVDEPRPNAKSHGYATAGWVAAPAAGNVIRRVAPILGMVPEGERIPQIQQAISIPLQPPKPPRAAAAAGAAPAAPARPPRSMPVPAAMPEPPQLRRTDAPRIAAPHLLAAAPPPPLEGASAPP